MQKHLRHDEETGELRLVYTDLWQGAHERTEYRVMSGRLESNPVRGRADLDGTPVRGQAPDLYVQLVSVGAQIPVWTEPVAVGPTVKTPCPRAANARRKCALCAELAA